MTIIAKSKKTRLCRKAQFSGLVVLVVKHYKASDHINYFMFPENSKGI